MKKRKIAARRKKREENSISVPFPPRFCEME